MNQDHKHSNNPGGMNTNALAEILVRRMNEVLTSGPAQVFASAGDPYLTATVVDLYARLAHAVRTGEGLDTEWEIGMTLPEGGRLLQLCIEGAMNHARDAHIGEPWFVCTTGMDIVQLGAKIFLGLLEEAAKQ